MFKKLLFTIALFSFTAQSQTFIQGTLNPAKNHTWVVLYQLKGAKQLYLKNSSITNGKFKVDFPENSPSGMYRLLFSQRKGGSVDFIYHQKSIEINFNPNKASESIQFLDSKENTLYHNYLTTTDNHHQKLDSLQLSYFKTQAKPQQQKIADLYKKELKLYVKQQQVYETETINQIANHFIKAHYKYYAPQIIETPQIYLNSIKTHFFDSIDFSDSILSNSNFFNNKATEYIFYLNRSDDVEVQNKLYLNATNEFLDKIKNNDALKSEIISTILFNFAEFEDIKMIDVVKENFYDKLPANFKNDAVIAQLDEKIRLAVGKQAPDFSFDLNGTTTHLNNLNFADVYVLVFWSTGCSHCLKEIPQLYEFTKDKPALKVLAVALEENDEDFKKYEALHTEWINILGLNKWQNPLVSLYQITATPTYFVLNKNKKIIAKPDHIEDLKNLFSN